jgi:hypothetical protein
MYLRRVIRGERVYLDLVEGHRDPKSGKVRQRVLGHLGREEQVRPHLPALIQTLQRLSDTPLLDPSAVVPEAAQDFGGMWLCSQLWQELELDQVLTKATDKETAERCFALVANRVLAPRSKLATHRWLERVARPDGGSWELEYTQLLRGMDALAKVQEQVEEAVYWQLMNLLRCDPTLVFVDLTSIYVEGEGMESLWQYGHSKDGKSQNKQLLLALVVTPDGYPLAHFLFEGNRAEKVAMLEMLQQLRHRFGLKRCVVVGDRGLISTAVLQALDEAGYDHILALRARQSKTATAALEREVGSGWTEVEEHLWVQEVEVPDAPRVVLAFNPQKQLEDRRWRERKLEQGWAAMDGLLDRWQQGRITSDQVVIREATRALVRMDAHRFFHVQVRGRNLDVEENQEHLEREARLDGVFILQSSAQDLDPTEIVQAYKQLLWVERAFRTLKSFLRVRPVYHFTERRIRAHIFLCVLGYLLENHLRQRLLQADAGCSARAALEAMEPLRVVSYELPGVTAPLRVCTRPTPEALAVAAALGYSLPARLPRSAAA